MLFMQSSVIGHDNSHHRHGLDRCHSVILCENNYKIRYTKIVKWNNTN